MIVQFRFPQGELSADVTPELLGQLTALVERSAVQPEELYDFVDQIAFFDEHASQLQRELAGKAVVIAAREVAFVGDDLSEALDWVQQTPDLPPSYVVELPTADPEGRGLVGRRAYPYAPVPAPASGSAVTVPNPAVVSWG